MRKLSKRLLVLGIGMALVLITAIPALSAPDKVRVFVEFAPGAKGKVEQALHGAGAEFHYTFDRLNSFVVSLPGQALKGLAQNPNVVDIEEDVPRYPVEAIKTETAADTAPIWADAPYGGTEVLPWGVQAVQAPGVWAETGVLSSTGAGATVCIIDTGYYSAHEDHFDVDLIGGSNQVGSDYYYDYDGHGTHVAGTVAAYDNEVGVIGVAPNASLYIIKYFGDDGLATMASDLVAAAYECQDNGANIISMSLSGTHSNRKEQRAFDTLYAAGLLSIGAASNDGIEEYHYPASYESVISVAALDEWEIVADFSQFNDAVELAAPGVNVLSTIPYLDESSLTVGGDAYSVVHIEFSGRGTAEGPLVYGDLCDTAGSWEGNVVLCQRGDISFAEKILNVKYGGGVAAVIYNNEPGNFLGTLGEDYGEDMIIGLSLSQEDGQYLLGNEMGTMAYLSSTYEWGTKDTYEAWGGTSMATPHVSAVAALLWGFYPQATNVEIREAMTKTARDLGDPERDVYYGFGLVQAKDALQYLSGGATGPLTVTIQTDPVYANKDTVTINVYVDPGIEGIIGAEVNATVTTADGDILTFAGLTDTFGDVSFTFKANTNRLGTGQYQVFVTASYPGREDGTASATFVVNKQ